VANIIVPTRARAAGKILRILQWVHFVPAYDEWFNGTYIKEWGQKNDTEVIIDNIHTAGIASRAVAEVTAQKGHDLFLFNWPPPAYEEQVVDMADVYQECQRSLGKPIDLAVKSTYNPKTKKYFAFSPSFTPDPVNWRQDLFSQIALPKGPTTWDEVRSAGRKIKQQLGTPLGIGLSQEEDTSMAMRTPDVFTWDTSSNNRWMLAGKCSLAVNAISITREAENKNLVAMSRKIQLARALQGPVRAIGLEHVMSCYVIWKFSENIAGAKKFLIDYTMNFKQAFLAGQFYNFPCLITSWIGRPMSDTRATPMRPLTRYSTRGF
jgi:multiple sugar transport system substrate-binding protein